MPPPTPEEILSWTRQIDLEEKTCQTKDGHYTAISILDPVIFIEKIVQRDEVKFRFRASFMLEIGIRRFDREYGELDSYHHRM